MFVSIIHIIRPRLADVGGSPNKHGQGLLLVLDVMVITEKNSVIDGKDQRLIIAVSFMFIHFPA